MGERGRSQLLTFVFTNRLVTRPGPIPLYLAKFDSRASVPNSARCSNVVFAMLSPADTKRSPGGHFFSSTMVLPDDLAAGVRLQIGRDRATVRYVGPVDGQVGEWVGLEWDDPARGKHDGSTGGKQYFVCDYARKLGVPKALPSRLSCTIMSTCCSYIHVRHQHMGAVSRAEGAGTFVRLSKLLPTLQPPVTVLQALRQRYQGAAMESCMHQAGDDNASGFKGLRGVEAELVGQEDVLRRQGRLEQLQAAVLIDSCVSSAVCAHPLDCNLPSSDDIVYIAAQVHSSCGRCLRYFVRPARRSLSRQALSCKVLPVSVGQKQTRLSPGSCFTRDFAHARVSLGSSLLPRRLSWSATSRATCCRTGPPSPRCCASCRACLS